ncbi:hypothetical protein TorRG33x02_200460 [Trema orientale]|uniref:Myb/SANT-like domain containing protein n=1 Tax=Trema orientale TaxID=63057 RepID=A0A2P5EF48_TREOI|nr:hypothetical protein TorRG33x02_200460 [Trema orientale]
MLEAKLPNSGLKASPHIESRVKILKTKYYCLIELSSLSGFDWDNEQMMLLYEKSVFDEWVKKRKDASRLYGKPFPYYHKLVEIYDRDRATGTNAGNIDDDEEEVHQEDVISIDLELNNERVGREDEEEIDEFDSISYTKQPTNIRRRSTENTTNVSQRRNKKKPKVMDEMASNIGSLVGSV